MKFKTQSNAKTARRQENLKVFCFCMRIEFLFFLVFILMNIFTMPLWAAFLDFSPPAREAALGGNGVALPEGTSSLAFNPAGLGDESRFEISARYENLFSGIEGDNLSTGNLSAVFPLEVGDGLGFSVDHFGANTLQQDQ